MTEQPEDLATSLLTVYTIGHSSVSAQDLIAALVEHQITILVDVRSVPYSQHTPQFNRETLEAALRRAGIEYRFARGPPWWPAEGPYVLQERSIP